eukprot:519136-Amphidinium_carterae.2
MMHKMLNEVLRRFYSFGDLGPMGRYQNLVLESLATGNKVDVHLVQQCKAAARAREIRHATRRSLRTELATAPVCRGTSL